MANGANGRRVAFEETQHAEPLVLWALGFLVAMSALPVVGLTALALASSGPGIRPTLLGVAAVLPVFVFLVFYVPYRARELHTTVTGDAFVVESSGLLFDRETQVPLDAVTRVACWEEFRRLPALGATFSSEGWAGTADRIHDLGASNTSGEMTRDSYLLRYRSASPYRRYAGLVRIERRDGPPVYVSSSRAGDLTDAVVRAAPPDGDT